MSEQTETVTEQVVPADGQTTTSTATDATAAPTPGPAPAEFLLEEDASEGTGQPKPFKLPSGVSVVIRNDGKGRDLLAAQRAAGSDENLIIYALISQLSTFNGQKKVMEDILEMPIGDVMTLSGKITSVAGGDFLPSTTAPSSTSQPSPAGATAS